MSIAHTTRYCRDPLGVVLFVFLSLLPAVAQADLYTYGFVRITSNSPTNVADQFSVDVSGNPGGNQVLFSFKNSASVYCSITGVYWDDNGDLLSLNSILGSAGVLFGTPATPANLPGGMDDLDPDFVATVSSDSRKNGGTQITNGVDQASESLGVLFDTKTGHDFDDVIGAINLGLTGADSLRIGIHVQSIGGEDGDSDSFVTTPVPGAILLGMLGLGAAGIRLRRFA